MPIRTRMITRTARSTVRPSDGLMALTATVGLLASVAFTVEVVRLSSRERDASAWVAHTLEVLVATTTLQSDLAAAAGDGRGAAFAPSADTRMRFEAEARRLAPDAAELRRLTLDNVAQQQALDRLEPVLAARVAVLRTMVRQAESGDSAALMRTVQSGVGQALHDSALRMTEAAKADERRLLAVRSESVQRATRWTLAGLIACGFLMGSSGLVTVLLLFTRAGERRQAAALRRMNAELEARVGARTAELAASEAGFRLLAEHAGDMVSHIGADGARRYVSPAARRIFGVAPEALLGRTLAGFVHPADAAPVAALQARLLDGEVEADSVTFRVLNPERGEVWVEASAHMSRIPETGAPDGYVSVLRDVTERKRAELEIAATQARYRLLADTTSDVITCLSLDLARTYASPASLAVLGYEPDELLGHPAAAMIHPDDQDKFLEAIAPLVAGASDRGTLVYRARHRDGRWMWLEARAALVRDEATGGPASLVCSLRDVSERQASAERMQVSNAELERLARHLARSRDRAEEASKAKSRFLAAMSHELRTPLNGILGYAQLLRLEGGLTAAQGGRVEAMLEAGTHLLEMINHVLGFSEIEAGRVELRAESVDLRALAAACLDLVRPAAQAKDLVLTLATDPAAPSRIVADPTRVRQILVNMLGNAVKFTSAGSVELRLGAAASLGGSRIEVLDTGPGVAEAQRSRLFQDFERLGGDHDGRLEGAGLGLAISARLATRMGGRLGHSDRPGGGSVFWLELPAGGRRDGPDEAARATAAPVATPAAGLRVLVVDDVAMNRDIAAAFLVRGGHRVASVEDGQSAVQAAAETEVDVVLMDVRMPGMDGLEATRRIRALTGARGRVPVVALTAQAFAEQIEQCRDAGMGGHVAKPFTAETLLAAVAAAAARGGGQLPGPQATAAVPVFDRSVFERTAASLPASATAAHLRTLTERCEDLLARVRASGGAADASGMAEAAHQLAGSAGLFGCLRLTDCARDLEHAVRAGSTDLSGVAARLASALADSLAALRAVEPVSEGAQR